MTAQYRVRNIFCLAMIVALLCTVMACKPKNLLSSQHDAKQFFVFEIMPLIQSKCLSCHGEHPDELEGNLDLRSADGMAKGGEKHEELIVKGRPEFSPLYQAIAREDPDFAMPPKEGDALTFDEVQAFYSWIVAGAPWPDKAERKRIVSMSSGRQASRVKVKTSGGQSEQWEQRYYRNQDLWAYRSIRKPGVPGNGRVTNPIDAFIEEKIRETGLRSAPRAPEETLIKRAYYDLLGLPPSHTELQKHRKDHTFIEMIDDLLANPHYGEQWARHWLDVVRYSDSDGFSNDHSRPNAWRYRDYVVRSFNADKPFNQFVVEQLAGDELDEHNPELLIATGFLRMGPWEHTGMSVAAETRQFFLDDVTNIVGETFLATPLNCAKCHDHKYDPIPTKDYYQIQAVFATTQLAQRKAAFLPEENLQYMAEERRRVLDWIDRAQLEQEAYKKKEEEAARSWYQDRGRAYLSKNQRRKLNESNHPPRYFGLSFAELGRLKVAQKRRQIEERHLDRFEPWAYSVYSGPDRVVSSHSPMRMPGRLEGEGSPTFILEGGSVHARGEQVGPGVLSVVHHVDSSASDSFWSRSFISSRSEGRRLDFASWLTDPAHPMTARVMVNRIWQYHFGKGLAGNPNNFGASGEDPSHPQLLDWLASTFVENGWSIKFLHQLIMTSETYQRSSSPHNLTDIERKDPDNKLLTYFPPRRLEAEELRDAMLRISGELNTAMGGIPVRPEIPLEVALQPRHTMGSTAPAYQPSRFPDQRNRRSIYIERKRSVENPMLQIFNQNNSDLSCEGRDESTIVTQAFALINSPGTRARALALADQLSDQHDQLSTQISEAHLQILLRTPTQLEKEQAWNFIDEMIGQHKRSDPEQVVYPAHVEHEMFEEMTGESFTYAEYLDIYEDYIPDLGDHQVSPEVRALADYISVLFNTNEFLYVY